MLYSLSGKIIVKKSDFVVVETVGIGFKIAISPKTSRSLPKVGSRAKLFCAVSVSRDGVDLYGFTDEKELEIFEMLTSINGIGPKAALGILGSFNIENFLTAVSRSRADLLIKTWGIGRKKAERIVLELKDKIKSKKYNEEAILLMEADFEVESGLKNIGYSRNDIKEAIKNIPPKTKGAKERIRAALKFLSKK